ncbi:MAG TPA: hypothetical protein VF756_01810 [Thermoanaerobaculia bacterium]
MTRIVKPLGLILSLSLGGLALASAPVAAAGCCDALLNRCENSICKDKGGVQEFSCDPSTCQAVCICNVFP